MSLPRPISSLVTVLAALTLTLAGCSSTPPSYEAAHPDASLYSSADSGLQSKDLIEMTDKMAPDMLKIPEIAQSPTKTVIVVTTIKNSLTSDPSENLQIYAARIRAMLNSHARDRLAFVENRTTTEGLQAAEGPANTDTFEEGSRHSLGAPTRLVPQYTLKGEFFEKRNNTTSYYLCTFQLTSLKTGEIVWENSYETKTLNWNR